MTEPTPPPFTEARPDPPAQVPPASFAQAPPTPFAQASHAPFAQLPQAPYAQAPPAPYAYAPFAQVPFAQVPPAYNPMDVAVLAFLNRLAPGDNAVPLPIPTPATPKAALPSAPQSPAKEYGVSLHDFCMRYKLDDTIREGLQTLGYKPGDRNIKKLEWIHWKEAGFAALSRSAAVDAHDLFIHDMKSS